MQNPYLPYPVKIDEIVVETEDKNLKTFKFVFLNPQDEEDFQYKAGQFAELSVTGKGEIPVWKEVDNTKMASGISRWNKKNA